jgi:signal transduction histidine kinase
VFTSTYPTAPDASPAQDGSWPPFVGEGADSPEPGAPLHASAERPLILVVDDEPVVSQLVRARLRFDYEVVDVASGAAALQVLTERSVDLVLLDIMMPGMNGIEVCRLIKHRFQVPVLLMTALDDPDRRFEGLEAGADDYLGKPLQRRELELRVAHFVRLSRQERLIGRQLEALGQLTALKDDLAALLVHDLRNPLTGVMAVFDLLLKEPMPEANRELLEMGHGAAMQVMSSISDLLQVRMLEDGRLPLALAPVRLGELLAQAIRTVTPTALERGVTIGLALVDSPTLTLDRGLVQRAVENLLANAVRHTNGPIEVAVTRVGLQVAITIADRGPGIPGPLKADLFEKYGSLELQRRGARRGHGLGLYMVKLVTGAHGGSVGVTDREGGGAVFRLLLPDS